jgi:maltose alpha-D-glucosyltransferase/alpha-amylase
LEVMAGSAIHEGLLGGRLRGADVDPATFPSQRADAAAAITPLGVEQSNTSVRIGRCHTLKIIRRIQAGEHPQLEIERYLTSAGFTAAPRLDGSVTYVSSDGEPHAVAALEGWIDNQGDGWSFVLAALARTGGGDLDALARDLFALGAATAAFHATLAAGTAPAFAPEPVTAADADAWRARVIAQGEQLFTTMAAAHSGWEQNAAALARDVLDRRSRLAGLVNAFDLDGDVAAIRKIRVHGDYHLGQTLKTAEGFALIDFEGEPSRPLDERRRKDCALKDVAGMLRSLDYAAAASAARGTPVPSAVAPMRQAFLDGYFSEPRTRDFLPDRQHASALLSLFELEKALYEVDYELNNRPGWIAIPLSAVRQLLGDSP